MWVVVVWLEAVLCMESVLQMCLCPLPCWGPAQFSASGYNWVIKPAVPVLLFEIACVSEVKRVSLTEWFMFAVFTKIIIISLKYSSISQISSWICWSLRHLVQLSEVVHGCSRVMFSVVAAVWLGFSAGISSCLSLVCYRTLKCKMLSRPSSLTLKILSSHRWTCIIHFKALRLPEECTTAELYLTDM